MTLSGFRASNHPQQVEKRRQRAAQQSLIPNEQIREDVDDRSTPLDLFDKLHLAHGFTVDAAASPRNALLAKFWTIDDSGLEHEWTNERVWCNPPYSEIGPWVDKAWREYGFGCERIVMLLPANRTEQRWWQDMVEPKRDRGLGLSLQFLAGRLRFNGVNHPADGKGNRPPFGCCLLVWAR